MTINGFLNVLKPPGMTSHDVISVLRRAMETRQVGHTGTLDPGAAGVLAAAVGSATRLIQFLPDTKRYRAEMTLGTATDTQDASGSVISENRECRVSQEELCQAVSAFTGEIEQIPPMFSAVKRDGRRLYELAREGITTEREPRRVCIYNIRVVHLSRDFPLGFGDRVILDIQCSGGTYIRTLCHDLGRNLGCPAHMSFLVRTDAGPFALEQSHTLEDVVLAGQDGTAALLVAPKDALAHMPAVILNQTDTDRVRHGNRIKLTQKLPERSDQVVRLLHGGELIAVARLENQWVHPVRVLPPRNG